MPGVPSGRGCDACRRQKKKCDQARPACSRCARLRIACVGGGKQRFKFQESKEQRVITQELEVRSLIRYAQKPVSAISLDLLMQPTNETTLMASEFVSKLQVTDLRYNVSNSYGIFLKDIPRRLGRSAALDAAASAFAASFRTLYDKQQSVEVIAKYGQALTALRSCIDNPTEAATADTMCAMYLIMICQSWLGENHDMYSGHGEALAIVLQAGGFQVWQGVFEGEMLASMCIPVIIGTISNPKTQWFCDLLINQAPPAIAKLDNAIEYDAMRMRNLARFPAYVRDPRRHLAELKQTYHGMKKDMETERQRLAKLTELEAEEEKELRQARNNNNNNAHTARSRPVFSSSSSSSSSLASSSPSSISTPSLSRPPSAISIARQQHQALYGLFAGLTATYNTLIRGCEPHNAAVATDALHICDEIIATAHRGFAARPLGGAYAPLSLLAGWVAAGNDEEEEDDDDADDYDEISSSSGGMKEKPGEERSRRRKQRKQREQMETLLVAFTPDLPESCPSWTSRAGWMQKKFRCSGRGIRVETRVERMQRKMSGSGGEQQEEPAGGVETCLVM